MSILVAAGLVSASVGCWKTAPAPEDFGPLPAFSLTERSGQPVDLENLRGKIWVASFLFTRCAGPCLQIAGNMARLQHDLADVADLRLVSFTVDPEYDTPAILSAYAARFQADPARWLFLTGEPNLVYDLLRHGFKVGVESTQGAERKPGNEKTHSTKLVLLDRRGHIRGYFDGTDPLALEQLVKEVRLLEQEKP